MTAQRGRCVQGGGASPLLLAVALLALASEGSGCASADNDVDDGVVETEHLRITTTTDNPICAGTPLRLEREVVRIADTLELPLWPEDDKLDVRFGFDAVADVCRQWDPDDIGGCVYETDGEITLASKELGHVPHELVHAIRRHNLSLGPGLFEEGLAQVVSGSDGFPLQVRYPRGAPSIGVLELLGLPREQLGNYYPTAQSFVSWLWEVHGQSTLMAFMNDPRLPDDETIPVLFEEHFGQSLEQAEHAWSIDDRPEPIWGAPCIPERTYSLADGPVEVSGELDCRAPTVYGASYFMSIWPMCLDVPNNTRVRISVEADHGRLSVRSLDPCDAGSAGAEAYRAKYMDAGQVLEEDIAGCRHRLTFNSDESGFPPTPYTIRIEEIDP